MVLFNYGEWDYICRYTPQPICNLFFRQLLVKPERGIQFAPDPSLRLPRQPDTRNQILDQVGIGINPQCTIPRMESAGGMDGSVGNLANIIFCCLSILASLWLLNNAWRRRAAVARVEMMILFLVYGLMRCFEIFDTGSILRQGSQSIVWITSIHHALIMEFFGLLIWIGFLGFQFIEDGTISSLMVIFIWSLVCLIGANYIFLDTAFGISTYFHSEPASHLYSPWTFTMIILFPMISVTAYMVCTTIVSLKILREVKPFKILMLSLISLIVGEVCRWILNTPICKSSSQKVDGSFIGQLFESLSLIFFFWTWINLTEDDWEDDDMLDHGRGGVVV